MKIGKTQKVITSPKRQIGKAGEKEKPIPVSIPQKTPEKVPA